MFHFDLLSQINRILCGKNRKQHFKSIRPKTDVINDIYDGDLYKNFYEYNSAYINEGTVHSYTFCSDGIALCSKSKLSLTPIILSVNEFPWYERFCIENVVIAGKFL